MISKSHLRVKRTIAVHGSINPSREAVFIGGQKIGEIWREQMGEVSAARKRVWRWFAETKNSNTVFGNTKECVLIHGGLGMQYKRSAIESLLKVMPPYEVHIDSVRTTVTVSCVNRGIVVGKYNKADGFRIDVNGTFFTESSFPPKSCWLNFVEEARKAWGIEINSNAISFDPIRPPLPLFLQPLKRKG